QEAVGRCALVALLLRRQLRRCTHRDHPPVHRTAADATLTAQRTPTASPLPFPGYRPRLAAHRVMNIQTLATAFTVSLPLVLGTAYAQTTTTPDTGNNRAADGASMQTNPTPGASDSGAAGSSTPGSSGTAAGGAAGTPGASGTTTPGASGAT